MSSINYAEKIPNNVNLVNDRTLQRALEHWQPHFLDWWKNLGPSDFQASDVYLRTAVSVDAQGWAQYGAVKMPDYRWGIFLADAVPGRTIGFGDQMGQPVWQQVPGEYRSTLRRLIVTQGDTEPASVEQQRLLGHTCPSAATAARKPRSCSRGIPATPTSRASSPPSTSRSRTGSRSSASPISPTATASTS
jgi:benzoyl-CoA 2,3-dioxygenase component B